MTPAEADEASNAPEFPHPAPEELGDAILGAGQLRADIVGATIHVVKLLADLAAVDALA
jgi:hypothetical protein